MTTSHTQNFCDSYKKFVKLNFLKFHGSYYYYYLNPPDKKFLKRDQLFTLSWGKITVSLSLEALQILKELNYRCEAENLDLKNVLAGVNFIAAPKN